MDKKLMLGNEAVARGLYEAGCNVISSYPGTPSTEITESAAKYDEMYSEWAPNEKVALEVAIGASIGGARSFAAMKHVGLNVAADPLFTVAYTGVNGGLVIGVADDPGMHSSQNEQDSRHYAKASKVCMLEPADSKECKEYTAQAFEISEEFDVPVIVRLSTRLSHTRTLVDQCERKDVPVKEYVKNPKKYVMMPGNARPRHLIVEQRELELIKFAETTPLNSVIDNGSKVGVITGGISYQYSAEALGDKVNYLKIGLMNPLPVQLIKDFVSGLDTVYVVEELDPIIETHCATIGVKVIGKELFSKCGEISQSLVKEKILGETVTFDTIEESLPVRPPVMCPGCPHRGAFYVLAKLGVYVSGDIGCYTLGALPPLNAMDTTICMGASVSALHGYNLARGGNAKNSVAVIGDSTFMHSGMTGLVNIVYNNTPSTVIIMDNSITGMTGHQHNPTTGFNIKGDPAAAVDLEAFCRSVGVRRVTVIDPFEVEELEALLKEELAADEPSVIITRRPCALLKSVKVLPPLSINTDKCVKCKKCFKIGCPAIKEKGDKIVVDQTLCVGCDLCIKLCAFDAFEKEGE